MTFLDLVAGGMQHHLADVELGRVEHVQLAAVAVLVKTLAAGIDNKYELGRLVVAAAFVMDGLAFERGFEEMRLVPTAVKLALVASDAEVVAEDVEPEEAAAAAMEPGNALTEWRAEEWRDSA